MSVTVHPAGRSAEEVLPHGGWEAKKGRKDLESPYPTMCQHCSLAVVSTVSEWGMLTG